MCRASEGMSVAENMAKLIILSNLSNILGAKPSIASASSRAPWTRRPHLGVNGSFCGLKSGDDGGSRHNTSRPNTLLVASLPSIVTLTLRPPS